jgi:peptidoglycan/xylan/chitin deacetylase (PgdA/CDA1 family)
MGRAYLTIDDAPTGNLSTKVDVLGELSVPAVFFCEGRRLEGHRREAKYAIESGYHLGNHTYSHPHASDVSPHEFERQLTKTEAVIESIYNEASYGRPERVFRFPYGDKGETDAAAFQEILHRHEFEPPRRTDISYDWYADHCGGDIDWYWTIDVRDWEVDSKQGINGQLEAAESELNYPSSDIILFHDNHNSAQLFRYFLTQLQERGVQFASPFDLV